MNNLFPKTLRGRSLRAYRRGWENWCALCEDEDADPWRATADLINLFRAKFVRSGLSERTFNVQKAAVNTAYEYAGLPAPFSLRKCRELRRRHKPDPLRRVAAPFVAPDLDFFLRACRAQKGLSGKLSHALFLMMREGALRRQEAVDLTVADLERDDHGFLLTNFHPARRVLFTNDPLHCAVRACNDWMASAGIQTGHIFRPMNRGGRIIDERMRSDLSIWWRFRAVLAKAGLDSQSYSPESLRFGLFYDLIESGRMPSDEIAEHYHADADVLRRLRKLIGQAA